MFKKILSVIMIFAMVLSLASCAKESKDGGSSNNNAGVSNNSGSGSGDKSFEYIKEKGNLIVGLDDSFPPMGFRDENNQIVGFDIDLARAVSEKLGVELVLQPIDWDSKVQELNTKNIDCIWNGLSLTPKNQENMTTT